MAWITITLGWESVATRFRERFGVWRAAHQVVGRQRSWTAATAGQQLRRVGFVGSLPSGIWTMLARCSGHGKARASWIGRGFRGLLRSEEQTVAEISRWSRLADTALLSPGQTSSAQLHLLFCADKVCSVAWEQNYRTLMKWQKSPEC